MAPDASAQQKQGEVRFRRALFWWSLSLGLLLFAVNVVFFFLLAFSTTWGVNPNLSELSCCEDPYLDLKFFLLLSLLFFLAGVLLGRSLEKMRTVVWVNSVACLIGSGAMVALAAIMVIFGIGAEEAGWTFLFVVAGAPFLIGVEALFGVGGGALGGLIGSRFPHWRSAPDGEIRT